MEDEAPIIYGLEFQARALTSVLAESDVVQFFVGTQSLKSENHIHQIDYDEETNAINKTVYIHREGEIWDIKASPTDKNIVATCFNKVQDGKCETGSAIWQIPTDSPGIPTAADDNTTSHPSLELLCRFSTQDWGSEVKKFIWQPDGQQAITLVDSNILLWDVVDCGRHAKLVGNCGLDAKCNSKLTTAKWNPHQNHSQVATANDTCIRGWDLRGMQQIYSIENAHGILIRDMDFNPNKQYYLASCGDDCKTKFWDVRNVREPLKVLASHSHWVWCVRFNHFHDQLILTSSSDSCVILTNVTSLSSEPLGHLLDDINDHDSDGNEKQRSPKPVQDGVIGRYEEHEDSVYAVEWSSADPWLFASLSYDGRLVINRVPKAEKYKILL